MRIRSILLILATLAVSYAFMLPLSPRIKQTKNLITGTTSDYTYTKDGKISVVKNSIGVTSTYQYTATAIYRKIEDSRTKKVMVDTFLLNDKGLTRELRSAPHLLSEVGSLQWFEYTPEGFQKVMKGASANGELRQTMQFYYVDSNESNWVQNFAGDAQKNRSYCTYYTDRLNTIGNENMGMAFQGRSSKNLVKEIVNVWLPGDTSRSSYHYHFDDKGRVMIKAVYYKGKLGDSIAYSYY